MAKNFNIQNDTKLAKEVQKYKCLYGKAYKTFFPLDFSLIPLTAFDNYIKAEILCEGTQFIFLNLRLFSAIVYYL